MKIAIIENGGANFLSVVTAIEKCGAECIVTQDSHIIRSADGVILPGVGAAKFAMQTLRDANLIETIINLKQPVLGICLGLQLLFTHSHEGEVDCLDIIKGQVAKFNNDNILVPHMGWNSLDFTPSGINDPIFAGIDDHSDVYFVHSYYAAIGCDTLASCNYGVPFSAVVKHNNFYGMQFHPEKSGNIGLRLLNNFIGVVNACLSSN